MSRSRGESWKSEEDVALCISVVKIGEDGDQATGQAKDKLWARIANIYATMKPEIGVERLGGSCEARWRRIRPACTKWREALTKAEAAHSSGQNATDLELQAKSIYRVLTKGKDFMFSHCWRILHDSLKFSNPISLEDNYIGPSPISLDGNDTSESPSPSTSTAHARPIGQKAQKLAKKAKAEERSQLIAAEMRRSNELAQLEYEQTRALAEETRLHAQRLEEDNVMSKDPSQFPPPIRAYWEERQAAIIARMQRERAWTNEGYVPNNPWMG